MSWSIHDARLRLSARAEAPGARRFSASAKPQAARRNMPHILFLTGKLAEPALRRALEELGPRVGFEYSVGVLPITVAALATTPWIARHYAPAPVDRIILPGLCNGELGVLTKAWGDMAIDKGPEDLRDLPDYFGSTSKPDY